jgi:ABC-type Fe3+-hydroxamate transport system substrate-binding protein
MLVKLSTPRRREATTAAALAGFALLTAVTVSACSPSSSNASAAPSTSPTPQAHKHNPNALRGAITGENKGNWTIQTAKGATYTIDISPKTAFGTKQAPATAQSFPVGTTIVVRGAHTGNTVNATRIAKAPTKSTSASTSPSASPAPAG